MAKKKDAVEVVDRSEDEAARKREDDEMGGVTPPKDEEIICCPKCKRPVTEGDYIDQLANPMQDSVISKIECPECGYMGMPIEITPKDYAKLKK